MISCYDSSKELYHNSFIGRKLFHRHKWINRNSKFINKWLQLHSQHFFIQYFLSKSCTKSEYICQYIQSIDKRSFTVDQTDPVTAVLLFFPGIHTSFLIIHISVIQRKIVDDHIQKFIHSIGVHGCDSHNLTLHNTECHISKNKCILFFISNILKTENFFFHHSSFFFSSFSL